MRVRDSRTHPHPGLPPEDEGDFVLARLLMTEAQGTLAAGSPPHHGAGQGGAGSLLALAATVLALIASSASAQTADYPVKPVRVIVGQAPGGGNDLQTRLFAQKLTEAFGRSFIVENRPGSGSVVS